MDANKLEIGDSFLYERNPNDNNTTGIGEVLDISFSENFIKNVEIKWIWYPQNNFWTVSDWYYVDAIRTWEDFARIITEKEKLALLLTYNFG